MIKNYKFIVVVALCSLFLSSKMVAQEKVENSMPNEAKQEELNIKELILEHLADSYEWHIEIGRASCRERV